MLISFLLLLVFRHINTNNRWRIRYGHL